MQKIDERLIQTVTALKTSEVESIVYLTDLKYINLLANEDSIRILKVFDFIKAVGVTTSLSTLQHVAKEDFIKYATVNSTVCTQVSKAKELMNLGNFYKDNYMGQGINVAVIDTGISPLPDFCMPENRIIKFVDLVNNKNIPYDDNGHGTFISGVLLGNGLLSKGKYAGVAPKAGLIAIKALDANGEAGAFRILDAMQWVYNNHIKYNIKVVCMSFGSEPLPKHDPLVQGAEMLWKTGITVVVAGGNSGPEAHTIKSPGVSARVITVGGLDDGRDGGDFKVADFSSRGPAGFILKPDILAPSTNIISNNKEIVNGKGYTIMSGTSVATPMIAGVACLVLQKYPFARPEQIKNFILHSGHRLNLSRNEEGFGWFVAK